MVNQAMPANQQLLFQGLLRKDPKSLRIFYLRLRRRSYAQLRTKYPDYHLQVLDDCFNMAFLKFLQKIGEPNFKLNNLEAYAFQFVLRFFKNALKRAKSSKLQSLDNVPQPSLFISSASHSIDDLLQRYAPDKLYNWYLSLPDTEKQLLQLRMEGYKLEEIAPLVGRSFGTIRNKNAKLVNSAKALVYATR